jgi:anti-sigma B factor antagonist
MSLHIDERENEGITVLDLDGALTAGQGDAALRAELQSLHLQGKVDVIVNLKRVGHIDSAGLGGLVFGMTRLRKAGGKLVLLNLSRRHVDLFTLTRLSLAFELYDEEHEAVNSFFPDRAVRSFDVLSFVKEQKKDTA